MRRLPSPRRARTGPAVTTVSTGRGASRPVDGGGPRNAPAPAPPLSRSSARASCVRVRVCLCTCRGGACGYALSFTAARTASCAAVRPVAWISARTTRAQRMCACCAHRRVAMAPAPTANCIGDHQESRGCGHFPHTTAVAQRADERTPAWRGGLTAPAVQTTSVGARRRLMAARCTDCWTESGSLQRGLTRSSANASTTSRVAYDGTCLRRLSAVKRRRGQKHAPPMVSASATIVAEWR